jgi:integrase
MSCVYRKGVFKPVPAGAEVITRKGEKLARWRDRKGKTRTAPLTDDGRRVRIETGTWYAKYRDGQGVVVEVPTGCRDETAARQVLADLERKAERVRAGLLTPAEARTAEHLTTPIAEHFDAYLHSLEAAGSVSMHRHNVQAYLKTLATECRFRRLADLKREALERWLVIEARRGRSARSRNAHQIALAAFCNWAVQTGRLMTNPFKGVAKADEKADRRRQRRAMTEDELARLLDAARHRPLLDALTVRRGKRKGQIGAFLRPEIREQLESLGRERALIYKTLVLTVLRKGELASLTVGQLRLDGPTPYVELDAADEKNREGNAVPIRADLADDLRSWLADRLAKLRDDARLQSFASIPSCLLPDTTLFDARVSVRTFDRDLRLAGIPKRDD